MKKAEDTRFMKSKFNNTEIKNQKVKLTDLCPQEKAKIGELIKTLETLKTQNYQLQEEVKELKENIISLTTQLEKAAQSLQSQLTKNTQYRNSIKDMQRQIKDKVQQISNLKKQNLKKENISIGICTQQVVTLNFSVQTNQKKKKTKNRSIQTNIVTQNSHFQKPSKQMIKMNNKNSASFEKIISAKQTVFNTIWNNYEESHHQQMNQIQNLEYSCQSNSKIQDQQFGQLADKWLELKQKNMNIIRKQYQKGQVQMLKFQPIKQIKNQQNIARRNRHIEENEQQQSEDQQLNRMLKKQNFSASRFMNRKSTDSKSSSLARSKSREKQKPIQKSNISNSKMVNISGFQPQLFDLIDQIQSEK